MKIPSFDSTRTAPYKHPFIQVLALLSLTLLPSCNDQPPVQQSYCEKNPGMCETVMEAKDYFAFKQGSWWVYEEETSHERDSMYVYNYQNDVNSPYFECDMRSSLTDYEYYYYPQYTPHTGCSYTGLSTNKCVYIHREKGKIGDYVGEDICFFIQYRKGDQAAVTNINYQTDKITIEDIFTSYTLNSLVFSKTIKVHEDHTYIEHNNPTNHYFSKGVGLIRKELIDSNQVWNLVSYHIEP